MEMTEKIKTSINEISKSIGTMNMNEIISLAWGAKEILRGDFKKIDYGRIILPFIVLRRLGRVLESTKEKVLKELEILKGMDKELVLCHPNFCVWKAVGGNSLECSNCVVPLLC